MPKQDRYCLNTLRAQLLDHPVYAEVAYVEDLRRFMDGVDEELAGTDLAVLTSQRDALLLGLLEQKAAIDARKSSQQVAGDGNRYSKRWPNGSAAFAVETTPGTAGLPGGHGSLTTRSSRRRTVAPDDDTLDGGRALARHK
jgi:hypothetical protein